MGRSVDILEIGPNDDLAETIRKCNYNFRNYSSTQSSDDGSISQLEDDVDGVRSDLAKQVQNLIQIINELGESLSDNFNLAISTAIAQAKKDMYPPVGTWLHAEYDPNVKYPGTTWVQYPQGYFVISSGSTYSKGSTYGSNTVTLTVDQIPSHRHSDNGTLMQWTCDNPNGSNSKGNVGADVVGYGWGKMGAGAFRDTTYTSSTGGSQPHSNIPLSIALPLWHRTK